MDSSILIVVALGALLVFMMFNTRRKQKAKAEQISNDLVPGASVMTSFGVFGTVISVDEENNQVVIESGPGTVLKVHRQAIAQIDAPQTVEPATGTEAGDASADESATPDVEAETSAEEAQRVTDAELDAMNEAKRRAAEQESGNSSEDFLSGGPTRPDADDADDDKK